MLLKRDVMTHVAAAQWIPDKYNLSVCVLVARFQQPKLGEELKQEHREKSKLHAIFNGAF